MEGEPGTGGSVSERDEEWERAYRNSSQARWEAIFDAWHELAVEMYRVLPYPIKRIIRGVYK